MEVIIIESEAYKRLLEEQAKIIRKGVADAILDLQQKNVAEQDWLTIEQARKLLPYRSKTRWQELRDQRLIEFTNFGRKIMYSRKSIQEFIKIHIK